MRTVRFTSLQNCLRVLFLLFTLWMIVIVLSATPRPTYGQAATNAPVVVEAIKLAKIRSGPGINYPELGQIVSGTSYPLIGRNQYYPWYLITLPDTNGWVFSSLVKVTGDVNSVPFVDVIITPGVTVTPTLTQTPPGNVSAGSSTDSSAVSSAGNDSNTGASPSPTLSIPSSTPQGFTGVTVEAISEARLRYGPGTDFPRVGTIYKGQSYAVLRRHALYPWLEIEYDSIASKRAWVSQQTVTVTGDLASVPVTSDHTFGYPTLTATPQMVVTASSPWISVDNGNNTQPPPSSDNLTRLGNAVYDLLMQNEFVPGTERQGSVFVLDLDTQQSISLNPNIAYSAVSMMKIPVITAFYRKLDGQPTKDQAKALGEMMVCSENSYSNMLLRFMGNGDENVGAQYVTSTMQTLGLKNTFLARAFYVGPVDATPTPLPAPITPIKTQADQLSTEPDQYNQSTPADLGWLLSSIYQCALDGTGPIATAFNGDVTMQECRHIIDAMRADKIGALIEAGVPNNIAVAHKHGWGDDTHGDAGLITSSGGDYVLVAMLHNQTWLKSEESFPLIAEISRLTYNTFNSAAPLDKIHPQPVPLDCTVSDQLISDFINPTLPPIK